MDIYICRGLPASGKSTWAKYLVRSSLKAANGQACRLNKDTLREMLHDGVYSSDNEKLVREIWKSTIRTCIKHQRTLIIDDCNLNPLTVETVRNLSSLWAREMGVPIKIHYLDFKANIETCIKRDSKRDKPVGEKVIRDMAKQYEWKTDPVPPSLWRTIFKFLFKGK